MSIRNAVYKNLVAGIARSKLSHGDDEYIKQFFYLCRVTCNEKAPENREDICTACHALARQYSIYPIMRWMMKRKWKAKSMKQMSLPELKELFYFMKGMEKIVKNVFSLSF